MLLGINLFGVVIGKISEVVAGVDAVEERASAQEHTVDRFLEMRRVPPTIRFQVARFLRCANEARKPSICICLCICFNR